MITWAALIVLQGIEGGVGEQDGESSLQRTNSRSWLTRQDLDNIRLHLDMLRRTNEPEPCLRFKLATQLAMSFEKTQAPVVMSPEFPMAGMQQQNLGYPWSIFSEASLQSAAYQFWPIEQQQMT